MISDHEASVDGARAAHERGELDRWVDGFLRSPGSDNEDLADELGSSESFWHGPVELPFDELNRLAGPPDQPALARLHDDDRDTVEAMTESIDDGWEPAPLIVSRRDGQLVVEDGNHRIEALRRSGHTRYWSVVAFDEREQRDAFIDEARH